MYLPLPAAFEAPKRGMSAFDPAPGKGLPSLNEQLQRWGTMWQCGP